MPRIPSYAGHFATAESPAWDSSDDYDSPWKKKAVEGYFPEFVRFYFFPKPHQQMG